jgi:hypothetical protein
MSGGSVYLNSAGLCCSLGSTLTECLNVYRTNMPAFRKATDMVGIDGLPPTLAARFPVASCRDYPKRLSRLLALALDDLRQVDVDAPVPASIHLLLPAWIDTHRIRNEVDGVLLDAFGKNAPRPTFVFGGPTRLLTTLNAIAARLEPNGVALLAAVDSYIQVDLLDALAINGRMLSRGNPHGSVPSEAAVVLRVAGRPMSTGYRIVSIVEGVETEDVRAPRGVIGRGLATVLRQTDKILADGPRIGRLMIGLTGERWRAEECGLALGAGGAFLGDLTRTLEAPLSITGDCGTASTAVMLALALADRATTKDPQRPRTLVLDSSRSGERAACVIEPVHEAA